MGLALGAALLPSRPCGASEPYELPEAARKSLETSPYVYVSPLHPDGKESRCHGEVWFVSYGGDVTIVTARDRWKTRAVDRGWDRARIWVGDFGRTWRVGNRFREGANFLARARREPDPAVFEVLMSHLGKKYAKEWRKWEPRFRNGYEDGTRVVIRYTPIGG